jgi:hypothetical protein
MAGVHEHLAGNARHEPENQNVVVPPSDWRHREPALQRGQETELTLPPAARIRPA